MIVEQHPGTLATNETDSNDDTFCLGTNFIVMTIPERTSNVYPYDTSYEPMYNVPIVTGALTYKDIHTGRWFIIFINEALYYGMKPGHSLIKTNPFVIIQDYGLG